MPKSTHDIALSGLLSPETHLGISRRPLLSLFLSICATFLPRPTDAQTAVAFDPLQVPSSGILCRWIPAAPKDSAAFVVEFGDGTDPLGARVSRAFFDSVGVPQYMFITALQTVSASEARKYIIVVQF
ncbi:MAG: hypothetical protein ACRD3J_23260, partial [Thermoanaerobaculia bacterium]